MDRWLKSADSEPGGEDGSAEDRDVLEAYFTTRWRIDHPGGPTTVSLSGFVGDLPLPCAVLTAYNPQSILLPAAENRSRDRALHRRLEELRWTTCRALARGSGDDAELWDEPGFAVFRAPLDSVVDLARAFDQNAVLWIDSDAKPWIVVTTDGFCGCPIGARLQPNTGRSG